MQLEFFESRGYERNFTNGCLKNVPQDFQKDQEIIQELMKFARICQISVQKVHLHENKHTHTCATHPKQAQGMGA
jgi:hypothetical protein